MPPVQPLPLDSRWSSPDEYVNSLLSLVTSSELLRNLCGGVHVLDFLTRKPDLYSCVLPQDWRDWFELVQIDDLLDLLFREDLKQFQQEKCGEEVKHDVKWRGIPYPPPSFISYVDTVRLHSLARGFTPISDDIKPFLTRVDVGMKPKKAHEVANFAAYVDNLSSYVSEQTHETPSIIDFGSGQNYLGRTLALPPYNRDIIAIERHHHNVIGARGMDVSVRLAKKKKIMRNKKEHKARLQRAVDNGLPTPPSDPTDLSGDESMPAAADEVPEAVVSPDEDVDIPEHRDKGSLTYIEHELTDGHLEQVLYPSKIRDDIRSAGSCLSDTTAYASRKSIAVSIHSCGNLTHHGLRSLTLNPSVTAVAMIGCCYNLLTERLGPATYKLPQLRSNHPRLEATSSTFDPHGFPMSKTLEEFEYEIPTNTNPLNTVNQSTTVSLTPSSTSTSTTPNPNPHENEHQSTSPTKIREKGIRLNITARMMAVQAPYNWTPVESNAFFTRHFYRALLQKILFDLDVVKQAPAPSTPSDQHHTNGNSLTRKDNQGTPLIIGSLRKTAFTSFEAYVQAAMQKLYRSEDKHEAERIRSLTRDLFIHNDDDNTNKTENEKEEYKCSQLVKDYETKFAHAKKNLSVIWSLMAFSASVIESVIVVDRWLWLREQLQPSSLISLRRILMMKKKDDEDDSPNQRLGKSPSQDGDGKGGPRAFRDGEGDKVKENGRVEGIAGEGEGECWVEVVFDYALSPRNLCVVGVKGRKLKQSQTTDEGS